MPVIREKPVERVLPRENSYIREFTSIVKPGSDQDNNLIINGYRSKYSYFLPLKWPFWWKKHHHKVTELL